MKALKNLTLLSQIALSIVTPILIGVYIGEKLDSWLKTQAIFLFLFIILGVFSGFLSAYRLIENLNFDKKKKDKEKEKDEE